MANKIMYYTHDAIKFVKEKYPYIPIWIIRRILFANDLYQHKIGILNYEPSLDDWYYKK